MSVKLDPEELKEFLENSHTLIMATIRKSGEPLMVPIWYVYMDGSFYIGTMAKSPKIQHIKRDPRVCCLVEEGKKWVDLKAVIAQCDASIVEDEETLARFNAAMDKKYKDFRPPASGLPSATKKHYSNTRVVVKMTPRPNGIRSWYNRKIRMAS